MYRPAEHLNRLPERRTSRAHIPCRDHRSIRIREIHEADAVLRIGAATPYLPAEHDCQREGGRAANVAVDNRSDSAPSTRSDQKASRRSRVFTTMGWLARAIGADTRAGVDHVAP